MLMKWTSYFDLGFMIMGLLKFFQDILQFIYMIIVSCFLLTREIESNNNRFNFHLNEEKNASLSTKISLFFCMNANRSIDIEHILSH